MPDPPCCLMVEREIAVLRKDTRYAPSKLGRYKIQDMKKPCDSSILYLCILYLPSLLGMYLFDKPKFEYFNLTY